MILYNKSMGETFDIDQRAKLKCSERNPIGGTYWSISYARLSRYRVDTTIYLSSVESEAREMMSCIVSALANGDPLLEIAHGDLPKWLT